MAGYRMPAVPEAVGTLFDVVAVFFAVVVVVSGTAVGKRCGVDVEVILRRRTAGRFSLGR